MLISILRRLPQLDMASPHSDMLTSQLSLMNSGKREVAQMARRKKTGSRPRKNCDPALTPVDPVLPGSQFSACQAVPANRASATFGGRSAILSAVSWQRHMKSSTAPPRDASYLMPSSQPKQIPSRCSLELRSRINCQVTFLAVLNSV